MNCPKCNHKRLYKLQNNYKKCAKCYYKFSYRKYELECQIITHFCSNINALESSKILNISYKTVFTKYKLFRQLIALHLENLFEYSYQNNTSYEEYYYFTQNQKNKKKSLYEAINLIGFYSNGLIYTLLMPMLAKTNIEEKDKLFEKFLSWHKLQSQNAYTTPINVFWTYLEQNLKKYKGINKKNFFYYLKECEFKFNFLVNRQIEILKKLYFI